MKYSARLIHNKEINRLFAQLDKRGRQKYTQRSLSFNDDYDAIIDDLKERFDIVKLYKTPSSVTGYYTHFILYCNK